MFATVDTKSAGMSSTEIAQQNCTVSTLSASREETTIDLPTMECLPSRFCRNDDGAALNATPAAVVVIFGSKPKVVSSSVFSLPYAST